MDTLSRQIIEPDLLARIPSLADFEAMAERCLPQMAFDYVAGGVGNEVTHRDNLSSWDRIRLRPRTLVDVSAIDTTVELFGETLPHPVILAPTAYHKLFHPDGEAETARGAALGRATYVVSSFSTITLEEVAAAAPATLWFQLYTQKDKRFTAALVQRAVDVGAKAIVLTVDQAGRGYRDRDIRNAFALPAGVERANMTSLGPKVAQQVLGDDYVFNAAHDPTMSWKDLDWLRSATPVKLLVKGVLTPEDALQAIDAGVDGIIVSNHGGRSLDTVPATADALPAIAEAVAGRVPLLVDGGIRRGTDVMKAIALGAKAVLIGRPYVFALAAGGAEAIRRVVEILVAEMRMSLALAGRPRLRELDRTLFW